MTESDNDFLAFAEFAESLADASRAVILESLGGALAIEVKPDASLVTEIDHAVEDRLRGLIADAYPAHGIIGEERGVSDIDAEFVWVLDPIDGTAQFIAGLPVFGTLIALARNEVPVVGVIDHPVTDERWVGRRGAATTRNGAAVTTRECDDLAAAMMTCSSPDYFQAAHHTCFARLRDRVRWTLYGGSCLSYAMLASGRTDLAVDGDLDPVDLCALAPVVEGAGGVMTDWQGRPLTIHTQGRVVTAGDRRLHGQALEILSDCSE